MNRMVPALAALLLAGHLYGCADGSDSPSSDTPSPGGTIVSPDGTSVSGPDGSLLIIPAGALQSKVTVRIAKDSTDMPALPDGMRPVGAVFAVTPHGQVLGKPATVRLPLPTQPLGTVEKLWIAKAGPGQPWELLAPETVGSTLAVQVGSFSWFVPVAVAERASLPLEVQLRSIRCGTEPCSDVWRNSALIDLEVSANGGAAPSNCVNPRIAARVTPRDFLDKPITEVSGIPLEQPYLELLTRYDFRFWLQALSISLPGLVDRRSGSARTVEVVLRCGAAEPTDTVLASTLVEFAELPGDSYKRPGPFSVALSRLQCNGGPCADLSGPQQISLNSSVPQGAQIEQAACPSAALAVSAAADRSVLANTYLLGYESVFSVAGKTYGVTRAATYGFTAPGGEPLGGWLQQSPAEPGRIGFNIILMCGNGQYGGRVGYFELPFATPIPPSIDFQPRPATVLVGETASFSVTVSGRPTPTLQWQSRTDPSQPWTDIGGASSGTYTTEPLTTTGSGTEYRVIATNAAGSAISSPVRLTVSGEALPPTISVQPTPLSVVAGSEAVFAVVARGTEALSYQWYRNGTEIEAANGAILKLGPVTTADRASYYVVVSNSFGMITSARANLTVLEQPAPTAPPTIVTQPAGLTAAAGSSVTFAVGVSGDGPFTYQWFFEGSEIPGATAAAYTLSSVSPTSAGRYAVRISNGAGMVTSAAAMLTVTTTTPVVTAPAITTHPATLVLAPGASATLAVAVSGTSPFTYRWFRNGVAVAGATGAVLALTNVTSLESGSYVVSVSNTAGTVTSNAADVIVLGVPAITVQPSAQTASDGDTATFSVVATGDALRYQWQRNGRGIPGAESASYTTPALSMSDSGALYSVIVYNQAGLVISTAVTLSVTGAAPTITTQPANASVNAGQTATFSVVATGSGTLGYQWRKNGTDITGATSSSYTTPATITADNGAQFTVVVSNAFGSVTSTAATLTVAAPPLTGTWGPTQSLEDASQHADDASVAINRETGDGVVVWVQSVDGVVEGVYANVYDADTNAWSGRTLLAATASSRETAYNPKAAINSTGDIVVAWMQNTNQSTGNLGTIRAARYKPGSTWSEAYILTRLPGGPEPTITWTNDVDVDMDFAGNATVVWSEEYGSLNLSLMSSARMPATGTFQTAELLESTQDSADAEWVNVVMDSAGNAIAAWSRRKPNSAGWQIVAKRRPTTGTWGSTVVLADMPSGGRTENPALAISPTTGDALIAWRDRGAASGSKYDLRYSRYLAAQSIWTSAALAESDATNDVGWLSVALNKLGQGAIAWERYATTVNIRAVRVDMASGALGTEIGVTTDGEIPEIGIDGNGNIMTVYLQSDGFRPRATALRLLANGGFESSVVMSSPSIYADYLKVAVADDGRAIAGWMEAPKSLGLYVNGNIYGRVFR